MRFLIAVLFLIILNPNAHAQEFNSAPGVYVQEEDGSPASRFRRLKFSNGSVTDNGDGSASITTGGGGNGGAQVTTIYPDGRLINLQNSTTVMSIISDDTNEYAGLWDDNSHLVLCQRARANPSGIWACYPYDGTGGRATITLTGDDYHDGITLGMDELKYIHVVYDTHADALKYRTSTNPQDISSLSSTKSMLGTNETSVTYTQFFNDNSGQLFAMFRDGGSGTGDEFMYEYTSASGTWAKATGTGTAGKFYDGTTLGNGSSMYVSAPYVDANNVAHFIYVKAYGTGGVVNNRKELSYFKYDITNGTFKKTSGTSLSVPWTDNNGDIIDPVGFDTGLRDIQNTPNVNADSSGKIYGVYTKADSNGANQVWVAILSAGAWTLKQLTQAATVDYQPLTANAQTAGDQPPVCLVEDDVVYVYYKHTAEGRGYRVIKTSDQFTTWDVYGVYPGDIGSGKINLDIRAFYEDAEIHQILTDHSGLTETYTRSPIYYLRWKPSDGFTSAPANSNITSIHDVSITSLHGDVRFNETQLVMTNDGNNGLGEASPDATLELVKTTGNDVFMASSTASSNGDYILIESGGNIGINSINPTATLELNTSDSTAYSSGAGPTDRLKLNNSNATANNMTQISFGATSSTGTAGSVVLLTAINESHTNGSLTGGLNFTVRNAGTFVSDAIQIDPSGNIGMGTIEPRARLSVLQTAASDAFKVSDVAGDNSPFIINSAGNVGIGTLIASSNLHVVGGVRITGLNCSGNANGGAITADANGDFSCTDDDSGGAAGGWTDGGTNVYLTATTDTVGIGTTTPTGKLDIRDDEVRVWDGSATVNTATGVGDLYVESDLEVDGTATLPAITTIGGKNVCLADGTDCTSTSGGWTDGGSNVYTSTTTDNVGIGTTTPSTTLEIVKQGSQSPLMVSSVATGDGNYLVVDSSGNVGIGSISPTQRIDANTGNVRAGSIIGSGSGPILMTQGNVGVGTTASISTLFYVASSTATPGNAGTGDVYIQNDLEVDGTIYGDGSGITGVSGTSQWKTTAVGIGTTGLVGLGTYGPSAAVEIVKNGTSTNLMISSTATSDGDYLIVTSAGNVGVSTILPANKLSVGSGVAIGLAYATIAAPSNGLIVQGSVGIGTTLNSATTGLAVMNGNVGIGTWNPRGAFEVAGAGAVGIGTISPDVNNAGLVVMYRNVGIGTINPGAGLDIAAGRTIRTAGNVGISTTKPNPTNVQITNGIITTWN